jgi:hypothetical protein
MSWIYNQSTGILSHDGAFVGRGYSGFAWGLNNPSFEQVRDIGPIPKGRYLIKDPHRAHPNKGPLVFELEPDDRCISRDDLLIHGDNKYRSYTGSTGCIVLDREIREQIDVSWDRELEVI